MGYPSDEDLFGSFFRAHVEWSERTFGPASERGPEGPIDHLRKEVEELAKAPRDLEEVADGIHLLVDVAWRSGHSYDDLMRALFAKQRKNQARKWPDWRTAPKGKAIEHIKSGEES